MQEINWAEAYFIIAMMVLILLLCVVSVWIFFRTYRKEMREKEERLLAKKKDAQPAAKN
jgi:cbb3-type cytochrome oxidase subunit 3